MEQPKGIAPPDPQQQSLRLEADFRQALHTFGRTITTLRPPYGDHWVITQRWLVAPDGTPFDAQAFYHAFDHAPFRQTLRGILRYPEHAGLFLSSLSPEHRLFLEKQDFIQQNAQPVLPNLEAPEPGTECQPQWMKGPALQDILDLGRTLEWYVAEWFRQEYEACACHSVEIQEMTIRGDADVLALKEDRLILVECKSSSDISEQKLRNMLQRIIDIRPDMTLLLIDTESPASVEHRTRQCCTLLDYPYVEGNRQVYGSLAIRWISSHRLYVANTGAGIRATLAAVLRLHEAIRQVQSYQRKEHI